MITTILLTIANWFIEVWVDNLPDTQIWPQAFIDGINYMAHAIANFNFIISVDTLFSVILFLPAFFSGLITYIIISKIVNFFRGLGKL